MADSWQFTFTPIISIEHFTHPLIATQLLAHRLTINRQLAVLTSQSRWTQALSTGFLALQHIHTRAAILTHIVQALLIPVTVRQTRITPTHALLTESVVTRYAPAKIFLFLAVHSLPLLATLTRIPVTTTTTAIRELDPVGHTCAIVPAVVSEALNLDLCRAVLVYKAVRTLTEVVVEKRQACASVQARLFLRTPIDGFGAPGPSEALSALHALVLIGTSGHTAA